MIKKLIGAVRKASSTPKETAIHLQNSAPNPALTPPTELCYAEASQATFLLMQANSMHTLVGVILLATVQSIIMWREVSQPWLIGWYALVIASQCVRHRIESKDLLTTFTPDSVHQTVQRGVNIGTLCALIHASVLLLSGNISITALGIFSVFYVALMTGAINHLGGQPKIYTTYLWSLGLPLVGAWLYRYLQSWDILYLNISGLILIFMPVLMRMANHAWNNSLETFGIRHRERLLAAQLREALQVAEQAYRAKARFFAAANHDLRQPLHSISLLTGVLKMRATNGQNDDVLSMLSEVVASLSSQLDDFLDLSRLDAGVMEARQEKVELAPLLETLFGQARAAIEEKKLIPELRLDAQPWVHSDPLLLTRIVRNLLHNATKFTSQGGVCLRLSEDKGSARIQIIDTGCGIAPEHHEEVFQEFFQVNNAQRDRRLGMGLGLSIVQRLAQVLQVQLHMESQLGKGTTFTLTLPILHTPAINTQPTAQRAQPHRHYGIAILLVEDELLVQKSMTLLLHELGCTTWVCDSTATAHSIAQSMTPDFIIADFRLRDQDDGLQAIAAIQQTHPHTPSVLISGDTSGERLRMVKQAGVEFLSKPVGLDDLIQLLDRHFPDNNKRSLHANDQPQSDLR